MGGKMSHVPYCFKPLKPLDVYLPNVSPSYNQSHHLTHAWFRPFQLKQ